MHCVKKDTIAVSVRNMSTNQSQVMNLNKLHALPIMSRRNDVIRFIVVVLRFDLKHVSRGCYVKGYSGAPTPLLQLVLASGVGVGRRGSRRRARESALRLRTRTDAPRKQVRGLRPVTVKVDFRAYSQ